MTEAGVPEAGEDMTRRSGVQSDEGGDDLAYAAALAALPGIVPATLVRLVGEGPARQRFEALASRAIAPEELLGPEPGARRIERATTMLRTWAAAASSADPLGAYEGIRAAGILVFRLNRPGYPPELADDPTAPAVLFATGPHAQPSTVAKRSRLGRVAVVGTRSSTHYGESVAASIAADLSAAGVVVVSGLAAGIDAAAHEGALVPGSQAFPLAIVGAGVDVVYLRSSARLFEKVRSTGAILSEAAPGSPPTRWRFPLRNRLIAASSDVLVVVESHASGGAMHTVEAADERGVPIAAVPGSVRSPASAGTNALLAEGAHVVRDADDVLALLGLVLEGTSRSVSAHLERRQPRAGHPEANDEWSRPASFGNGLSADDTLVLSCVDATPTTLEEVLRRSGLELAPGAVSLERLVQAALVRRVEGGYEVLR